MTIGKILFFSMVFAPQSWQTAKIPMVVISSIAITLTLITTKKNNQINKHTLIWFIFMLTYGTIWSLAGALKGNEGAADCARLNIAWVLIYFVYIIYLNSHSKFSALIKTMLLAGTAISIYNALILLEAIKAVPSMTQYINIDNEITTKIGIHSGYTQLSSINIGSLSFIAPFALILLISNTGEQLGISKFLLAISSLLSTATVLLSGRRGIILGLLLAPFLALLFNIFNKGPSGNTIKKNIIIAIIAMLLIATISGILLSRHLNWSSSTFTQRFIFAFTGDSVRARQAYALFEGFSNHPLTGVGFGKGVNSIVRSQSRPWTYELSYSVILYTTGLLGSLIYFGCIASIYYKIIKSIMQPATRGGVEISILVAFTCFLLANGTNPYQGSYDFMWMLYLPVAYMNLISQKKTLHAISK